MNDQQRDVREFLNKMWHMLPHKCNPTTTDPLIQNRINLLDEELAEVKEAIASGKPAQVGGELVDLIWSAYAVAEGCGLDLSPFWEEVYHANMKKTPNPSGKPTKPEGWKPPNLDQALRKSVSR